MLRARLLRYLAGTAVALICVTLHAQTPPAKPRFEVASVKPAANDQKNGSVPRPTVQERMQEMMRSARPLGTLPMANPGRFRAENWALLDLIAAAYAVRASQVSGPAWLSDRSFDIEAKAPDGAKKEELNAMLQSLLEERFGLTVHRDTRTAQGFALVVGKNGPKLKTAEEPQDSAQGLSDEEQKSKAQQQAQDLMQALQKRMKENRESGTPLAGLNRSNFRSITTEQLASHLVRFAEAPVVDETGLTGKYAVTIEIWKNDDVPGGTVFDAVEKRGLKLEPRKVTIETLVVDRVSKTPTGN